MFYKVLRGVHATIHGKCLAQHLRLSRCSTIYSAYHKPFVSSAEDVTYFYAKNSFHNQHKGNQNTTSAKDRESEQVWCN